MNRSENTTIDRLWLDSWDSQTTGCNRIKSYLNSEGTGYPSPPDGSYYSSSIRLQTGVGMYRIEGDFEGNNLAVQIVTADLPNGYADIPIDSFFDLVIISTKNSGNYGELGNIRFLTDQPPFIHFAEYLINSASHKTAAFRFVYTGDPATPWRSYSLNNF